MKFLLSAIKIAPILLVIAGAVLLLVQSKLMYFPRGYGKPTLWDLSQRQGRQIEVQTSQGRQVAFYLPPRKAPDQPPQFLWFVFGGNGSLSLDYDGEPQQWDPRFAYVFVDYPGYGFCQGTPNPANIKESLIKIGQQVKADLHWSEAELASKSGVLGHSLGCAAALIMADEFALKKAVLCAPFTTMTDMAYRTVGWPLCYLNLHRFDNVSRIASLQQRGAQVRIFHGQTDEVIPVAMSRSMQKLFPETVNVKEIPDCGHNEVIMMASVEIGQVLRSLSALPLE
jgi:pimeloyl-ACP methyl ester carboxylesterase